MIGLPILLIISLVLEGTLTTLPLVLLSLILLTVTLKDTRAFVLAFFSGVILDLLLLRTVGQTSVFFLIVVLLIFLYDRKYEVRSLLFVSMGTLISSIGYGMMFPSPQSITQIFVATLLASFFFVLLRWRGKTDKRSNL